jgi:hypothetical protein
VKRKSPEEFDTELKRACEVVERYARSIGKDCEVIFLDDGVQVAPPSWGGCVFAETLYDALKEAKTENDQ